MKSLTAIVIICALAACAHSLITESCLDCLKSIGQPLADQCWTGFDQVTICGAYSLSEEFYDTCNIPEAGWTWETCSIDETCARWCIKLYMAAKEEECAMTLGGTAADLKCHHYARLFSREGMKEPVYMAGIPFITYDNACENPITCSYDVAVRTQCYGDGFHEGADGGMGFSNDNNLCDEY